MGRTEVVAPQLNNNCHQTEGANTVITKKEFFKLIASGINSYWRKGSGVNGKGAKISCMHEGIISLKTY